MVQTESRKLALCRGEAHNRSRFFKNRLQRYAVFLKYVQKRGDFFDKSTKKQSEYSDCSEYSDHFSTVLTVVPAELVESIALADILLLRLIARQLIECLISLELRCIAVIGLDALASLPRYCVPKA